MKVRPYTGADAELWDEMVAVSPMGTFLHTRRFLSYHGDRFGDASLVLIDERGYPVGVFPAVLDPANARAVISHAGSTFGGLVHGEEVSAGETGEMLQRVIEHYRALGMAELVYRCIPFHVTAKPCLADQYALWRMGGRLYRRDLWNVIDLSLPRKVRMARLRQRRMRRALAAGLTVELESSDDAYREFHTILTGNLSDRHHVSPVHSAGEMMLLRDLFPNEISLWMVRDAQARPVAGGWFFQHGTRAWHAQYISTTSAGRELSANDRLIETVIDKAHLAGVRYFSFGASTEQAGQLLNAGLFDYKASFGFGSVVQDFFGLDLEAANDRA
jgi:hypothetical protein